MGLMCLLYMAGLGVRTEQDKGEERGSIVGGLVEEHEKKALGGDWGGGYRRVWL